MPRLPAHQAAWLLLLRFGRKRAKLTLQSITSYEWETTAAIGQSLGNHRRTITYSALPLYQEVSITAVIHTLVYGTMSVFMSLILAD